VGLGGLFASVVGSVVSAPFAGWLGDRFDRRRVLICADLAAAAVSSAMALTGRPEALVALVGLSSVVQSPFEPASAAALPNLVSPADVPRANALVATTGSAGCLLGPLLGVGGRDDRAPRRGRAARRSPARCSPRGPRACSSAHSRPRRPVSRSPELRRSWRSGSPGMGLAGAGRGLGDVTETMLLQVRTDDEVRSRVFAAQEGAAHIAFTMSALTGGLIVDLVSARGAFAAAAACGVGAVVVAARIGPDP
jgi:MFS family permease